METNQRSKKANPSVPRRLKRDFSEIWLDTPFMNANEESIFDDNCILQVSSWETPNSIEWASRSFPTHWTTVESPNSYLIINRREGGIWGVRKKAMKWPVLEVDYLKTEPISSGLTRKTVAAGDNDPKPDRRDDVNENSDWLLCVTDI